MRPRPGTVIFCAIAMPVTLAWVGCSDDTASPVAPTPATVAGVAGLQGSASPAAPNPGVGTGSHPRVAAGFDPGFGPSAAPSGGSGGATGFGATPTILPAAATATPASAGAGLNRAPGPGLDGAAGPRSAASDGREDASLGSPDGQADLDSVTAGTGNALLKASAPVPVEPIDNVSVPGETPLLTVRNAQGLFVADARFRYQFEVYRVAGGSRRRVHANRVDGGDGSTSYRVGIRLGRGASYQWRARAFLDGVGGPWSADAAFRVSAVSLGVPRPVQPTGGATVGTGTLFTVRNPTVQGRAADGVFIEIEVASDRRFRDRDIVARGRARTSSGNRTEVRANPALASGTRYFWRARAAAPTDAGRVASPWSGTAEFRTRVAGLGAPRPRTPIEGATADVGTHFTVRNGTVTGISSRVYIEIQVAPNQNFANPRTGRTHMRDRGETTVPLNGGNLQPNQRYYWRARATASVRGSRVVSPWSATANFRTRSAGGGTGPAGPFGPPGPPRNMLHIVQAVARQHPDALRNSCQEHGGSWRFMELTVERLRRETGRWGYNCKRGNCADVSHDVVAYYRGAGTTDRDARGSTNVAIIDIISNHCASNPQPAWYDMTQATADAGSIGRWKYPRE